MQREMKGLLHDIEKIGLRILRDTSSSKQRSKCRNKKRNLEGQLKKVAGKYNKIIAALAEVPDGATASELVNVERLLGQGTRRIGPGNWRRGGRPEATMEAGRGERKEKQIAKQTKKSGRESPGASRALETTPTWPGKTTEEASKTSWRSSMHTTGLNGLWRRDHCL